MGTNTGQDLSSTCLYRGIDLRQRLAEARGSVVGSNQVRVKYADGSSPGWLLVDEDQVLFGPREF